MNIFYKRKKLFYFIVEKSKIIKKTILVNFNTSGGSVIEPIEFQVGEKYGELPTPTKTGNIFLGWYTLPEDGQLVTADTIVTKEINTLYAYWKVVSGEIIIITENNIELSTEDDKLIILE